MQIDEVGLMAESCLTLRRRLQQAQTGYDSKTRGDGGLPIPRSVLGSPRTLGLHPVNRCGLAAAENVS